MNMNLALVNALNSPTPLTSLVSLLIIRLVTEVTKSNTLFLARIPLLVGTENQMVPTLATNMNPALVNAPTSPTPFPSPPSI
jgi:hypothetical protein